MSKRNENLENHAAKIPVQVPLKFDNDKAVTAGFAAELCGISAFKKEK